MIIPAEKYFPATASYQVHKTTSVIKNKLTEEHMRLIGNGPLLDIDLVFNGQLLHHFLLRGVTNVNPDVISFNILGEKGNSRKRKNGERLRELILGLKDPNEKDSSCKDVETTFEKFNFTNDEDVVNVALALFIEMVMIEKDKKTQFDVNIFGIVDDHEVFDNNNIRTHHDEGDNNEGISRDNNIDYGNNTKVHHTSAEDLPYTHKETYHGEDPLQTSAEEHVNEHVNTEIHQANDACAFRSCTQNLTCDALMEPEGIASKIWLEGLEMKDGKVASLLDHEAHMRFWVDSRFFTDYVLGQYKEYKPMWTDVNFLFGQSTSNNTCLYLPSI
ncbi:uncharacterized protein LOC120084030 [Benincasa hispida]|uniref:uncharacterized protein LOC120084030 n=1 Tax=Benincasa hispida TaxID=102211 RepID=UPI001901CF41|nr:uncharacterized protein LOC120084030 [Benincasa hispida]